MSSLSSSADVVVVGAGAAGLATALWLARAGVTVIVIERDAAPPPADPEQALLRWDRPSVPQWGNGHAIHGLGRRMLRERSEDVLAVLATVGVSERRFTHGFASTRPGDDDLVALCSSRPVFEWVLRRTVEAEPTIQLLAGHSVVRAIRDRRGTTGVTLADGTHIHSHWVVDATGHRGMAKLWSQLGAPGPVIHRQQAPTCYYARHFRRRPDFAQISSDFHFGPAGDLGFMRYSVLDEDSASFVVTLNTHVSERGIRGLRDPRTWQAVAQAIPALSAWVSPDVALPLSDVFSYAGRGNVLIERDPDGVVPGLVSVGDALCQTNPTHGWGISLGLCGSGMVADTVTGAVERGGATSELTFDMVRTMRQFFDAAASEDRERMRQAAGEDVDVTDPSSPLFCRSVVYRLGDSDDDLHRAAQRRIHLLDPPSLLPGDVQLVNRARALWDEREATAPGAAPSPDEVLRIIRTATGCQPHASHEMTHQEALA